MIDINHIKLCIVFDNYSFQEKPFQEKPFQANPKIHLITLWGFSCYIETPEISLLFDTGSNGRVLLNNMKYLNKDIKKIRTLFLSHHHWDHIGGLDSVIELNPNIDIIAPSSLSKLYIKDLQSMVKNVQVISKNSQAISDSMYSTGIMGDDVEEQSLIIDTNEGLIIITACAHSGIVEIAQQSQTLFKKKILLLMGGFHLMDAKDETIKQVIHSLKQMDITYVFPTHCTGDRAKELFKNAYHSYCIDGGLGRMIYGNIDLAYNIKGKA